MTAVEPWIGDGEVEPAEQRRLNALWRQANRLAASELVPDALRGKPKNVMAVVLYGDQFGLTPAHALAQVHIIKGRIVPSAHLMAGLAMAAGHQVRFRESSSEVATVAIRRREDVDDAEAWQSFTFTIEDAERGKLTEKEVWRAYPAAMLAHRATSRAVRHVAPDVLLGIDVGGDDGLNVAEVLRSPATEPRQQENDVDVLDAELVEHVDEDAAGEAPPGSAVGSGPGGDEAAPDAAGTSSPGPSAEAPS